MQTVIAGLVKDGFYRCPTEEQPTQAFASLDTDCTDVMVGEMIPPCITLFANSSFTANMKTANGRFLEESFVYSKPKLGKFGFPATSPLNTLEGIRAYLARVTRPAPFEAKLKRRSPRRSRRTPPRFWASSCRRVPAVWSRDSEGGAGQAAGCRGRADRERLYTVSRFALPPRRSWTAASSCRVSRVDAGRSPTCRARESVRLTASPAFGPRP